MQLSDRGQRQEVIALHVTGSGQRTGPGHQGADHHHDRGRQPTSAIATSLTSGCTSQTGLAVPSVHRTYSTTAAASTGSVAMKCSDTQNGASFVSTTIPPTTACATIPAGCADATNQVPAPFAVRAVSVLPGRYEDRHGNNEDQCGSDPVTEFDPAVDQRISGRS